MISKGRSPRYPRIPLAAAVGYVRRLYDEAHKSKVDADTAARLMGFSGKSGASSVALGAIRQYGLVDGLRGDIHVSDLALRILQPLSKEEEGEAIHEAALKPDVFDSLSNHFEGEFPKSDEPIKAHLIREKGFSQTGAAECVNSLRKTLEEIDRITMVPEVALEGEDSIIARERQQADPEPSADLSSADIGSASEDTELIRIPLTKGCTAELKMIGSIDQAGIDRLIQYIQLMRDVWADD